MTKRKPPEEHKRTGRPTILTPEIQNRIVAYIRAGAWQHVAAGAAGVSLSAFHSWMTSTNPRYEDFQRAVNEAKFQSRATAEIEVRRENPHAWLRQGPGRGTGEDNPGWTDEVHRMEIRHEMANLPTQHITDEDAKTILRLALDELESKG